MEKPISIFAPPACALRRDDEIRTLVIFQSAHEAKAQVKRRLQFCIQTVCEREKGRRPNEEEEEKEEVAEEEVKGGAALSVCVSRAHWNTSDIPRGYFVYASLRQAHFLKI